MELTLAGAVRNKFGQKAATHFTKGGHTRQGHLERRSALRGGREREGGRDSEGDEREGEHGGCWNWTVRPVDCSSSVCRLRAMNKSLYTP